MRLPLTLFITLLIALWLPSPLWAQQLSPPTGATSVAAGEARPFPEQTGPPAQAGDGGTSTAGRLGAEAFGGVVGTFVGALVGAGVGLGIDYVLLPRYYTGIFTTVGMLGGAIGGAGWGVSYGGDSMGRAASWWAPYVGAVLGWPVASALAAAYLESQRFPSGTQMLAAFSLAALGPTLGAMVGYELTIAPASVTSTTSLPAGLTANDPSVEEGIPSPHFLQMRIRF